MKLSYSTIIILLIYACNPGSTDKELIKEQKMNNDSVTLAVNDSVSVNKNRDTINMSIIGSWTDGLGENATFSVDGKKIFFVEHLTTERIFMKGDTGMVYYQDDSLSTLSYSLYKIHSDTLIYDESGIKKKYWKFGG